MDGEPFSIEGLRLQKPPPQHTNSDDVKRMPRKFLKEGARAPAYHGASYTDGYSASPVARRPTPSRSEAAMYAWPPSSSPGTGLPERRYRSPVPGSGRHPGHPDAPQYWPSAPGYGPPPSRYYPTTGYSPRAYAGPVSSRQPDGAIHRGPPSDPYYRRAMWESRPRGPPTHHGMRGASSSSNPYEHTPPPRGYRHSPYPPTRHPYRAPARRYTRGHSGRFPQDTRPTDKNRAPVSASTPGQDRRARDSTTSSSEEDSDDEEESSETSESESESSDEEEPVSRARHALPMGAHPNTSPLVQGRQHRGPEWSPMPTGHTPREHRALAPSTKIQEVLPEPTSSPVRPTSHAPKTVSMPSPTAQVGQFPTIEAKAHTTASPSVNRSVSVPGPRASRVRHVDSMPTKAVYRDFLLKRQARGGPTTYHLTRLAEDRCKITVTSLRYKDKDGTHKEGVQRFVWLPSASANHVSGPASGFVMVVANPSKTPADPRVFHRNKFYWGTYALRVPRSWSNELGESFYDILMNDPQRIASVLKSGLGNYEHLCRESAFVGVYTSNRRENGWVPEAWLVVQCTDVDGASGVFASLKKSSITASEVREARTMLSEESSRAASIDPPETKKTQESAEEPSEEGAGGKMEATKEERKTSLGHKTQSLRRIIHSAVQGENTWTTCFGPHSQLRKLHVTACDVRRNYMVALLAGLGFRLKPHEIDTVQLQVETSENFVRYLPSDKTWAYYGGVTCVFSDTRAVILHERPLHGIVVLTGRPTSEHPLGEMWPPGPKLLGGAFPYSTGRIAPLSGDHATADDIQTSSAFFDSDQEYPNKSAALHPRLASKLYRARTADWVDLEYAMGRPETGGEIHLKPYIVLCAPRPVKRVGLLQDLLM